MCYIYLRLLFGIACLAYHTAIKFALYQPLYPEFVVNSIDHERAAATFVQFACTLHGKHNIYCHYQRYHHRHYYHYHHHDNYHHQHYPPLHPHPIILPPKELPVPWQEAGPEV